VKKNKYIARTYMSIFMLLVFAFATTPKRLLHHLITSHQHSYSAHQHCTHHYEELTEKGFHCDIDNTVVEAPYVYQVQYFNFLHIDYTKVFSTFSVIDGCVTNTSFYALRGPPSPLSCC
jgi:hypothetical protein